MNNISLGDLSELLMTIPPLAEQSRIVTRVEALMRLCDALEAKGQLEAAQHAQLVSTLLGTLTASTTPEELAANWQRVAQHFDLLLDRPEAIDALEQTLLQLAVRGLLVPQDPTDEPANHLLVRLRSDRTTWLAARASTDSECRATIKKLRDLPDADHPFPIPSNWSFVRLLDCCRLLVDCHNKTAPYAPQGIPIIRTSNIRGGRFRLDDLRYVTEVTYDFWSRRCPPEPGDIMFTREAPMGEAAIIPPGAKYCLGQRTMLVRPMHEFIDKEYLLLALTEPHLLERAAPSAIGSTVKHLRVGDVEGLTIPLPPFAEQSRIVTRVTALRRLCADLRQRLAERQVVQARLAEVLVQEVA
jgi:type I restriction enzyme, S subunit